MRPCLLIHNCDRIYKIQKTDISRKCIRKGRCCLCKIGGYNWKAHYAVQLTENEHSHEFFNYKIEGKTGDGKVISCSVFPGIQAVYNDLKLFHCGRTVPRNEEIIEINYCIEGRYECEVNNQYCFFAGPGDLSVGIVGRREAAGGFPIGCFTGLTLFINLSSPGHFSVAFREKFAITPGAYKKHFR